MLGSDQMYLQRSVSAQLWKYQLTSLVPWWDIKIACNVYAMLAPKYGISSLQYGYIIKRLRLHQSRKGGHLLWLSNLIFWFLPIISYSLSCTCYIKLGFNWIWSQKWQFTIHILAQFHKSLHFYIVKSVLINCNFH